MAFPAMVHQAMFAVSLLNCVFVVWIASIIIRFLPGLGPNRKRGEYVMAFSFLCFRYILMFPCPWIRVHGQQLKRKWKEIEKEGGPYIIANHNSKMDSLLILALLPFSFGPTLRTLVKDALFSLPLFGGMCTSVGHFPVYFKGTKEGDFRVNREAQAKVATAMDEYVKSGGGLLIFPEGQVNKSPRRIQPLRRGAFNLPIEHKKAIWGFLNIGCEKAWPFHSVMGGFPCDIYVRVFKVTEDASNFNNVELADYAREVMQKNLDEMYAMVDGDRGE